MPNWCSNQLHIAFENADRVEEFVGTYIKTRNSNQEFFCFEDLINPDEACPYDFMDQVQKQHQAWGTKWMPDVEFSINDNYVDFLFDTAWNPPVFIYRHLWKTKEEHGIIFIDALWAEGGCNFSGKFLNNYEEDFEPESDDHKITMKHFGLWVDEDEQDEGIFAGQHKH